MKQRVTIPALRGPRHIDVTFTIDAHRVDVDLKIGLNTENVLYAAVIIAYRH